MNTFINFLAEANLCLVVLFLAYWLLFRNDTEFRFQRGCLLASVLLSVIFPLIRINGGESIPSLSNVATLLLPPLTIGNETVLETTGKPTSQVAWEILLYAYFGVGSLLFLVFIFRLGKLIIFLKSSSYYLLDSAYRIIESASNTPAFSFFHYIVLGNTNALKENEKNKIIQHEMVHVRKLHSLDLLLLELTAIVFWFNPVVYLIKKTLSNIHEFQADNAVATKKIFRSTAPCWRKYRCSHMDLLSPITLINH